MGWPLRGAAKYREFGGSFIYPMGEDMVTLGMVVGLDYRDAELSVHDLLQELKTHPLMRKILEGGERIAWGAKTIPEGGCVRAPEASCTRRGCCSAATAAGLVNVPALKGIHYAVESGIAGGRGRFAALQPGEVAWRPSALRPYDEALREGFDREGPVPRPQHAAGVRAGLRARVDGSPARRPRRWAISRPKRLRPSATPTRS